MATTDFEMMTLSGGASAPSFEDMQAKAKGLQAQIFSPPEGMTPAESLHRYLDYLEAAFEGRADEMQDTLFEELPEPQQAAYNVLLQRLGATFSPAVDRDDKEEDDKLDEPTRRIQAIGQQIPAGPQGNSTREKLSALRCRNARSLFLAHQIQQLELGAQAATLDLEQQLAATDGEGETDATRQAHYRRLDENAPRIQALQNELRGLDSKLMQDIRSLEIALRAATALHAAEDCLEDGGTQKRPEVLDEAKAKAKLTRSPHLLEGLKELKVQRDLIQKRFMRTIQEVREMLQALQANTLGLLRHDELKTKAEALMQDIQILSQFNWLMKWSEEELAARHRRQELENAPPSTGHKTAASKLFGTALLAAAGPATHVPHEMAHERQVMAPLVRQAMQKKGALTLFGKQVFDSNTHVAQEYIDERRVMGPLVQQAKQKKGARKRFGKQVFDGNNHVAQEYADERRVMAPLVRKAMQKKGARKRFGKQDFNGSNHVTREQVSEAAVTNKYKAEMASHKTLTMTQLKKMPTLELLATVLMLHGTYQTEEDITRKARLSWANEEVRDRQQLAEQQNA